MPMKRMVTVVMLMALLGVAAVGIAQVGTWTRKADMPIETAFHGAVVVDGTIYIVGGSHNDYNPIMEIRAYNPWVETWTEKADIPTGRFNVQPAFVQQCPV